MDAQREDHEPHGLVALQVCRSRQGTTQDHRRHDLRSNGLESVSALPGAVTDVVPDQISNHSRVSWVILRNILLDLPDQISTDIGTLGVDTASQLSEHCHHGGAEPVPRQQQRELGEAHPRENGPQHQNGKGKTLDHQANVDHRGKQASTEAQLDGVVVAFGSRICHSHICTHTDPHACVPRQSGTQCAHNKSDRSKHSHSQRGDRLRRHGLRILRHVHQEQPRARARRQNRDGPVLNLKKAFGSFLNSVRHRAHLLGTLVKPVDPGEQAHPPDNCPRRKYEGHRHRHGAIVRADHSTEDEGHHKPTKCHHIGGSSGRFV
mmetsp:Transcript_113796/g.261254  ORF Transcript_113796/g.261254 Transcript_113796/m.261254 type:complete len:320 (-) Transcript_113796:165-1124(-)